MDPDIYGQQSQTDSLRRFRPLIILGVIAFIVCFALFWFYSHAYITVTINNSGNGNLSYTLTQEGSDSSKSVSTGEHTIKRLVHRGSYEALAQQGESSYFEVTKTGGFLSNTVVSGNLTSERARRFVGNNPASCINYVNGLMVSFDCGGVPYSNVQVHEPATATQPTYNQPFPGDPNTTLEGVVTTSEGNFALSQTPFESEEGAHEILTKLGPGLTTEDTTQLNDLDTDEVHSIAPYKNGFIVYDSDFDHPLYYSSSKATPTKININASPKVQADPYAVAVSGNSIALAYPNNAENETGQPGDTSEQQINKSITRLIIGSDGNFRLITLSKSYGSMAFCGTNKLCLWGSKQVEVYALNNYKPSLLYTVSDVDSMSSYGQDLLLARGNGIYDFNVDQQSGYISYSLGDYTACGTQPVSGGYVVCVTNNSGKKVGLFINAAVADTDSIDKKVAKLQKLPGILNLSAYGNYIFISPNLGSLNYYDASNNIYEYDPTIVKSVNDSISQAIAQSGINTSAYHIINTSQQ